MVKSEWPRIEMFSEQIRHAHRGEVLESMLNMLLWEELQLLLADSREDVLGWEGSLIAHLPCCDLHAVIRVQAAALGMVPLMRLWACSIHSAYAGLIWLACPSLSVLVCFYERSKEGESTIWMISL